MTDRVRLYGGRRMAYVLTKRVDVDTVEGSKLSLPSSVKKLWCPMNVFSAGWRQEGHPAAKKLWPFTPSWNYVLIPALSYPCHPRLLMSQRQFCMRVFSAPSLSLFYCFNSVSITVIGLEELCL